MFYFIEKKTKTIWHYAFNSVLNKKTKFLSIPFIGFKDILVMIEWPHPPFILNISNIQLPNINKSLKGHEVKDLTS